MLILEFNIIKTNFKIKQLKKLNREQFKESQFVKPRVQPSLLQSYAILLFTYEFPHTCFEG